MADKYGHFDAQVSNMYISTALLKLLIKQQKLGFYINNNENQTSMLDIYGYLDTQVSNMQFHCFIAITELLCKQPKNRILFKQQ